MPRRALTTCSTPACPELVTSGRCPGCSTEAEQRRGTSASRGYGKRHRRVFRAQVLERDVNCVLCIGDGSWTPATVADHWPLSRRELTERGLDPDDPKHGRGLCARCHNQETARNQPGGWNER